MAESEGGPGTRTPPKHDQGDLHPPIIIFVDELTNGSYSLGEVTLSVTRMATAVEGALVAKTTGRRIAWANFNFRDPTAA